MGFQDTSSLRHYLFVRDSSTRCDIRVSVQVSLYALLDVVKSILPDFRPKMFGCHLSQGSQPLKAHAIGGGECR